MKKDIRQWKTSLVFLALMALNLTLAFIVSGTEERLRQQDYQDNWFRPIQDKKDSPVKPEILLLNDSWSDSLQLGIYFEIEPGWYLYWLNPGEAGLPPQVKWELPQGFNELRVEFPVPLKFFSSGYLVYGYKEELLLVSYISKPKNFIFSANRPIILKANLNWMVCRESCLIGEEQLVINLTSIDPNKKKKAEVVWNKFKDRFPRPSEEINVTLKETKIIKSEPSNPLSEILVSLTLGGQDLIRIIDFYPLPLDGFIIKAEKTKYRDGLIELYWQPVASEAKIKEISGLLISQNSCYIVKFPLNEEEIRLKNNLKRRFKNVQYIP